MREQIYEMCLVCLERHGDTPKEREKCKKKIYKMVTGQNMGKE